MYTPFILAAFVGIVSLAGTLLIRWLTNRPLDHKVYSPEEIEQEMKAAFVERRVVELTTTMEYLPLLFEKLSLPIEAGLPDFQIAALIHRISNQPTYYAGSGIFPVTVEGVASDLDVQWIKVSSERIQMRIEAVEAITKAVEQAATELPSTAIAP